MAQSTGCGREQLLLPTRQTAWLRPDSARSSDALPSAWISSLVPGLWSINYRQIKTPIVLMVYSLYRVENDLQNVRPALGLTTLLLQFY